MDVFLLLTYSNFEKVRECFFNKKFASKYCRVPKSMQDKIDAVAEVARVTSWELIVANLCVFDFWFSFCDLF